MLSTSSLFLSVSLLFSHFTAASPTPEKRASSNPKYVVAHHIVGNTYPYTISDWLQDITLAHQYGIDAFALNVGPDSWQPARVADAYAAAKQSGTGFKLFFSLDMSVLSCASTGDATNLANWVGTYATHPNQFTYPPSNPKAFLSTFSGSSCTFGQSNAGNGWAYLRSKLTGKNSTYFIPAYFVDPATFNSSGLASSFDGAFQWNSAWQIGVTTPSLNASLIAVNSTIQALPNTPYSSAPQGVVKNLQTSMTADGQYIRPLISLNKTYMASVSPWFFTHYSPQTYNKNWVYISDYLYPLRWQSVVSARSSIDLVEVVTWNDYGESHYIGPIHGAQPNSQAWVNGMDHTPWLNLTAYYASAYKTGSYPAITKDALYLWARKHPANATATSDSVGPPNNFAIMQDSIFVFCFATSAASVFISTNANGSQAKMFSVTSGVNIWQVPLVPGGTMWGQMSRNGQTVLRLNPSANFTYVTNPQTYNYNAYVAGISA